MAHGLQEVPLSATLATARLSQEIADRAAVEAAGGDHAVVDDYAAVAASDGYAVQHASIHQARQPLAVGATRRAVEFGRVEIREADLYPGRRVDARPKTEAVAVADVANEAREGLSTSGRQPTFARICLGDGGSEKKPSQD